MSGRVPRLRPEVELRGSRFVIATSGFADGPAQPLGKFLVDEGAASVHVVAHPLVGEGPAEHRVTDLVAGTTRTLRRPNRPPFTYVLDPVTPVRLPAADVWFGFNCLVTAQGLLRRRVRRVGRVVHWSVDFVPDRFGPGVLTKAYEALDRWCVTSSDARVELSSAARDGRLAAYGLTDAEAPAEIVPMGSWTEGCPHTTPDRLRSPRLVFLGHLVDRMGVPTAIRTVSLLRGRGLPVPMDVIGGGPIIDELRALADAEGVGDLVTFHGFVERFSDVQDILSRATVALAPYDTDEQSFSRFADPGKLKAYLGAALPILLTRVPPNADELASRAGAQLLDPEPVAFADAVAGLLADEQEWTRRHEAALAHSVEYDWATMFRRALPRLGVLVPDPAAAPSTTPSRRGDP